MANPLPTTTGDTFARPDGWAGFAADWSSDQRAFKTASWGKVMMWIFLLSDTFIFSCFLLSYMTVRMSTTVPWPNPSEVFALQLGGKPIPLILIAIMTFILISSSGTMAMAVNYGYRRDRKKTAVLMLVTAAFGASFVGMQAFEWTKLIREGVRPWANPWGAEQFGSSFFMITGFHGTHVTIGVIFLLIIARKVWRGDFDQERRGLFHQPEGPLRERRDHGSVLALRRSGLGVHLRTYSISGEERMSHAATHARAGPGSRPCRGATTSDQALSRGLGMAVRPQHMLLPGRLLRSARLSQMVSDPAVHDPESGADRRGLHAYGLGAADPDLCHSASAYSGVGIRRHHDISRQTIHC